MTAVITGLILIVLIVKVPRVMAGCATAIFGLTGGGCGWVAAAAVCPQLLTLKAFVLFVAGATVAAGAYVLRSEE